MPFKILKDSKMQWFQSRINHYILATNTFLYKINVTGNSNCTFCLSADETIKHLLWECERVQCFLKEVTTWLSQKIYIVFDEKSFLFNIYSKKENEISRIVFMEIKYNIYYSRCSNNSINITALKYRVKLLCQTLKQAFVYEGKYDFFQYKMGKKNPQIV